MLDYEIKKNEKIVIIPTIILSSFLNAQQTTEIKVKKIIEFEKSYVFKFKNLKTKKIDYFFPIKKTLVIAVLKFIRVENIIL